MAGPTSTFSADSAAGQSPLTQTEFGLSASANTKNGSPLALNAPGASRATAKPRPSQRHNIEASGFSQEVLLASQSVTPGSAEARRMTAGYGRKLSQFVTQSSPLGSALKTLLASQRWASTESFLTWKGSATRFNRSLYRLVPSIRHRTGKGYGFWATAQSRDSRRVTQRAHLGAMDALPNQLKAALWATPQESQPGQGDPNDPKRGKKTDWQLKTALWPTASAAQSLGGQTNRGGDRKNELLMGGMLRAALWPTAKQQDQRPASGKNVQGGPSLSGVLKAETSSGSLAPTVPFVALQLIFTAWLFNLPLEYLENFVEK